MMQDPYKYFRTEAREILDGLSQGALDLERGGANAQQVGDLLRLAHTLKGAARVVKQPEIADLAHKVEDILSPYREARGTVPGEHAGELLQLLDRIAAHLVKLDVPAPSTAAAQPRPRSEDPFETVRVEVEDVEELLLRLSQTSAQITAMRSGVHALGQARELAGLLVRHMDSLSRATSGVNGKLRRMADDVFDSLTRLARGLSSGTERLERELAQTQERANRLRLLPCSAIFPALARAVRDAAASLGKSVEWQASGGEIRVEAQVLVIIRDALLHLVRNAVAHGIETASARAEAGKPPSGRVEVQVQRRGSRVTFLCRDDGAGIDVAAIRRAAIKKGATSAAGADSLGLEEAIQLILHGGVSTTAMATGISGRGIGLDVARSAAEQLKGQISMETETGRGTAVQLRVPISATSIEALMVESAGVLAAIPLDAVRRTIHFRSEEIAVSGNRRLIHADGQAVPFFELAEALERQATTRASRPSWPSVILSCSTGLAAIGVDRLCGTATVLARSVPALAAVPPVIAGACLDSEGKPQLVLDPEELVEFAQQSGVAASPQPAAAALPVLIVDDSLTTRMVEQSILESAGYRVELATSGEEGLEKAQKRKYGLFLVDIEMPGMNGFEFIAKTRADAALKEIPSILVTSRNSAEDRRRGQEAGSRAYIAKSEFNQNDLLQTIERLMR